MPQTLLQLLRSPKAMAISESDIQKISVPYLNTILTEHEKKEKVSMKKIFSKL